ncbi:XK-related protein 7 [Homalodisca vitripennis]|uniref:XK-related protein 7 n=1 Tax=Homalodisca vitripennis TaxID=197043 RepID=UPI001EEC65CA|nr:XK-related protein 7 [Homalodisca vitripennis]
MSYFVVFKMDTEYDNVKTDDNFKDIEITKEDIISPIAEDEEPESAVEEIDNIPETQHVTNWDILVLLVSIFSHIIDVALDINLAYRYFRHKQTVYFLLTVVFILFPACVNTGISIRMYMFDTEAASSTKMAIKKWTIRIFVLLFQLAPIMRYCDSLDYALKSRRAERIKDRVTQRKYYELMLKEDSDVALLRVFECFLEAAPQQILQVAIVLVERGHGSTFQLLHQLGSISSSLLSMAWSMASYHRSIRFCQKDKTNLTWSGTAMQFLWHFMITVSRILSISAVASAFPVWSGVACAVHWLVMTLWLSIFEKTQFSLINEKASTSDRFHELVFCATLGLVYIFTYLTPSDGSTRNRYLIYYPICFVENAAAITTWAITADDRLQSSWYFVPFLISGIVPFLVGIVFMVLYYKFFHPKTSRKVGVSSYTVKEPITDCTTQTDTCKNDEVCGIVPVL